MSEMPKVGDKAPDFTLQSDAGESASLSDFRGKKVVLYFYPKDMTSGCTKEATSFRDDYAEFQRRGIVVLGVSPDPVERHVKFREKYDLPFSLLSDPDHKVSEAYGVWAEKKLYGRSFMGILRTTFVIDEQGKVAKVFAKVKPEGHSKEVLDSIAD